MSEENIFNTFVGPQGYKYVFCRLTLNVNINFLCLRENFTEAL